jgi:hypothetical protein
VEHPLVGDNQLGGIDRIDGAVGVADPARVGARRDVDPDAVTGKEGDPGGPEVDAEPVRAVRVQQRGCLGMHDSWFWVGLAGACPDDAVQDVERVSVRMQSTSRATKSVSRADDAAKRVTDTAPSTV